MIWENIWLLRTIIKLIVYINASLSAMKHVLRARIYVTFDH